MLCIAVCLVLAATSGCYNYDNKEVNAFLLKPRSPVSAVDYHVLPPDVLRITSPNVPEMADLVLMVGPSGKISIPLIGEIYVANNTPKQIEADLTQAAKQYYEQASVAVRVDQYKSRFIYVFGKVDRPGPIPWTGHNTLLDALGQANPTYQAWPERITLVRGDEPVEGGRACTQPSKDYKSTGVRPINPENPRHTMTFNLLAMIEKGDFSNNVLLQPNDVIYVRANPLAATGEAVQSLMNPVMPPLQLIVAAEAVKSNNN
jgi:polysaccharide export outer membrane protein